MSDIEKAIEVLKYYKPKGNESIYERGANHKDRESFNLAIAALEEKSDKNCSRCADRNRCAIHKNFNIDYCSDWSVEE